SLGWQFGRLSCHTLRFFYKGYYDQIRVSLNRVDQHLFIVFFMPCNISHNPWSFMAF
ncbi:MAG: hypothetical protein ACI9S7_000547, partial [Candidatus Paceibacteria bacterium]